MTVSSRRVLLIATLTAAVLVGFVAVQNLTPSSIYYLTPSEARQQAIPPGQAVRLGGLVLAGTLAYDPTSRLLLFSIGDGTTSVAVVGRGAPPALLREGAGAVVEGAFADDGTFRAVTVLAKHNERYAPPSPGATPRDRTVP